MEDPKQREALARVFAEIVRAEPELARLLPRQPRYRYFAYRQHRFCWTTEPMDDGTYRAFEYSPVGPGARSGKARTWKLTRKVKFKSRAAAKRRAGVWHDRMVERYEPDKIVHCAKCHGSIAWGFTRVGNGSVLCNACASDEGVRA